jgi:prophage regulatory protein
MNYTVLRLPAVKSLTGLSRSTIYAAVKRGDFPPPIPLGARAIGWVHGEIEAWLQSKMTQLRLPSGGEA